jgi:integrase
MYMNKVLTHKRNSEKRIADIKDWKIAEQDKKDIKDFLNAYERGEITGRIGTNIPATIERTLEYLKPIFIYLNKTKSVSKIKKTDKELIQDLLNSLLKDKIKSNAKKPYSLKVKKFMFKTFINYLKWKLPDDCFPLVKILNIKISGKLSEPEYLTPEEIEKLYKRCSRASQRFFIAVLFSSGTRAEEFHNIRMEDIELPKENDMFVKLRIKNTTSKTKGRTISLYWKYCLEATREYLNERINEGIKPDEPIFKATYNTARKWLRDLGRKVLNKNVHYHLFRSSCATWMCDKLTTKTEYCYFFGWTFSSPMPDIYISRKGISLKLIDEKFKNTEFETIRAELEKEKFNNQLKKNEQDKNIEKLKKNLIVQTLSSHKLADYLTGKISKSQLNEEMRKIQRFAEKQGITEV